MFYLVNLMASRTGMRLGEIQSLKIEHFHKDHIIVEHPWDRVYGLKGTKTGKNRIVTVDSNLYSEVSSYMKENVYEGLFIFSKNKGVNTITRPISIILLTKPYQILEYQK